MKNICYETYQQERCVDKGYNTCKEYRDDGYKACENWIKIIRWLCLGWYWVSHLVCIAYRWIERIVCEVFDFVKLIACVVVQAVSELLSIIVTTLESVVGWVLSGLAFIVDLILAIPIIGRLIRMIINTIFEVIWQIVGIIDFIAGLIGVRPLKKLRVCPIILKDKKGNELIKPADAIAYLQTAVDIFYEKARVVIFPGKAFNYTGGYSDKPTVDENWFKVTQGDSVLNVDCGIGSIGEDFWIPGSGFEAITMSQCFFGNFRRLIGYGGPIPIFFVKSVNDSGTVGCSNLFLTNYVAIQSDNPICIGHELGHCCTLGHNRNNDNLMYEKCGGGKLNTWQKARLRNSRHVTYF